MRGQLLLLRLLNTRRSLSTLTRIVPSDPTPLGFSPRFFSSRPIRSIGGGGGGGRNPEFSRNRGPRRGEFELENFGRRGGDSQTKSLIEDEAELSDWVSDLKTDSIRVGLSSESEDSDRDNKGRARVSGRDRSSDRGGRDRFSISKRRGESDSDDLITSRSSRGGSNGSFWRNSRGSMSSIASKRKFDSDDDEDEDISLRRQRGHGPRGGSNGSFSRNKRGSMSGIASKRKFDSDDDEEEDSSLRRQRGHGPRGGFSPPTNRGGRGSDLSSGRGRQGSRGGRSSDLSYGWDREGGGMSLGRQAVKILEDDDEDEDDDDDDDEDVISDSEEKLLSGEDGEETFVKDERLLPELAKEDSLQPTLRISAGENDSYLSQTRFDQCSISPLSLKGIKAAGYEKMTVVQEATLPVILKG